MKRLSMLMATAFVALALGCGGDSSTGPKVPQDVNGVWTGSSAGSTVTVTLATQGSSVTGNGQFSQGTASVAIVVTSGTYVPPNLSLTLNAVGFSQLNFAGTRTGNTIAGTLNGSGFTNQAITLTKQ